ncbi:hypothetical protein THAOC_35408, partial [Thalassiosira oceanica]
KVEGEKSRGRFYEVSDRFQLERNIDFILVRPRLPTLPELPDRLKPRGSARHTGTADQLTRRQELVGVRESAHQVSGWALMMKFCRRDQVATAGNATWAAVAQHTISYPSDTFFVHSKITGSLNHTMSCVPDVVPVVDDGDEICANCGKQGSDTVKLRKCTACRIVKYCGVDCQRAHRKQHKKACKQRAAELKDERLYSLGHERPEGDFCPLCTLPIPMPMGKYSGFNVCCMKKICDGCNFAAQARGFHDCAFCRAPLPENDPDMLAMVRARVAKKDPAAINFLGYKYYHGELGLQKDLQNAVELLTDAAELGSIDALCNLGIAYDTRGGVENIKRAFMSGAAKKEQYAEALKGYHDAVEETKSHDRDEAKRSRSSPVVPVLASSSLRPEASMARSSLGDSRTRKFPRSDSPPLPAPSPRGAVGQPNNPDLKGSSREPTSEGARLRLRDGPFRLSTRERGHAWNSEWADHAAAACIVSCGPLALRSNRDEFVRANAEGWPFNREEVESPLVLPSPPLGREDDSAGAEHDPLKRQWRAANVHLVGLAVRPPQLSLLIVITTPAIFSPTSPPKVLVPQERSRLLSRRTSGPFGAARSYVAGDARPLPAGADRRHRGLSHVSPPSLHRGGGGGGGGTEPSPGRGGSQRSLRSELRPIAQTHELEWTRGSQKGDDTATRMSCVPVEDDGGVCANCGKQGTETLKLKDCNACRLVKYCGVDCQRAHRKQHKNACKQREAELKDEQLYSQGHERPEGDFCPICTLPIPIPMGKHSCFNVCCMKRICDGCDIAAQARGMCDCPFCRSPYSDNDADKHAMVQARVAKKDQEAINFLGEQYFRGDVGLQKDMQRAVELWTEAAELGSTKALFNLGAAY